MFCHKCGNEIKENAIFCHHCGSKIKNHNDYGLEVRTDELLNDSQYEKEKIKLIKKLRDDLKFIETKKNIDEHGNDSENPKGKQEKYINSIADEKIENRDIEENINLDIYDEQLKNHVAKEEKYDIFETIVNFIGVVIGTIYYMRNGNEIIISIISSFVLVGIVYSVFVAPIIKRMKKDSNCLNAKEKYEKYTILKKTMEPSVAFQMVELEFKKSEDKHGVLYYLLCVLAIILIFALC